MNANATRLNQLVRSAEGAFADSSYEEAISHYLVAADLAEEIGSPTRARSLRREARRLRAHVWALEHVPDFSWVGAGTDGSRTREIRTFHIRAPTRVVTVTVDNRGRVRPVRRS